MANAIMIQGTASNAGKSLLAAGLCGAGGQFSITKAYCYAPAREISVYDYTQVLFAAVWGFVLFGQRPDALSVAGYAVIIGAAVWMYRYNRRQAAVGPDAPPAHS